METKSICEIEHLRLSRDAAKSVELGESRAAGSCGVVHDLSSSIIKENRQVRR